MAFQVIFSTHQVPAGVISSFNAGNNQVSICATSVVLTATVTGSLAGHTVEWEQLSGVPVTFTTPLNQLIVQFNMVTTPDRLFRFWIDRYTPFAMFDDVWIFGTPISNMNTMLLGNLPTIIAADCRTVQCDEFGVVASTPLVAHNGVASCGGDTNQQLIWNNPECDNDKFHAYVVESNTGTGWAQHAIITDMNQRYLAVPAGMWYRIVTVFDDSVGFQPILSSTVSCQKLAKATGAGAYAWDSSSVSLSGSNATIPVFDILQRSLTIKDDPNIISVNYVELSGVVGDALENTFNVTSRSLTIKDDPNVVSASHVIMGESIAVIIGYDVLLLDGSVIGG